MSLLQFKCKFLNKVYFQIKFIKKNVETNYQKQLKKFLPHSKDPVPHRLMTAVAGDCKQGQVKPDYPFLQVYTTTQLPRTLTHNKRLLVDFY